MILDGSKFETLTKDGFKNLHCENIVTFSCNSCELSYIELGVLQRFIRLRELYLAGNNFNTPALENITSSLSLSSVLSVLDLSELPEIILKANTFVYLSSLLALDLRWSMIIFMEDGAFRGLINLQTLYLSYITIMYPWMPPIDFFPPNLQELYLDEIDISKTYSFLFLNELLKLSIRKSSHYPLNMSLFSPENSLKNLDLSFSILIDIPYEPFAMLYKLNTLDLSNSQLSLQPHLFHNLKNLMMLNLTNCGIFQVVPDLFRDQLNLRVLILRDNFITGWSDTLFTPLENLEELYLTNNEIKILNESFYRMWTTLKIDLLSNPLNCSCEMLWFRHQIEPNITKNTVKFLNKDEYTCAFPVKYAGHLFIDVVTEDMEKKCQIFPWYISIVVAANSVALILFFISLLCYKYRWYIRWYCYKIFKLVRLHNTESGRNAHVDEDFKFYIAYADEDCDWVEEFIMKFEVQLISSAGNDQVFGSTAVNEDSHDHDNENSYVEPHSLLNRRLNIEAALYYEKRHALPNKSEISQMGDAIFASRNVVIIVSLNYLNNSKHQFELDLIQQAMVERYGSFTNSHMIFVTLEKSKKIISLLTRHLRHHFDTTALIWNKEDIVRQTRFWEEFNKRIEQ